MSDEKSFLDTIREAVSDGRLPSAFSAEDVEHACPGWGHGTYNAYLWKHAEGNPGRYPEYFRKVGPNSFELLGDRGSM